MSNSDESIKKGEDINLMSVDLDGDREIIITPSVNKIIPNIDEDFTFRTQEYFSFKFTPNLDSLELNNEEQEKEILDLMYTLHSLTNEVDWIKKSLPVRNNRRIYLHTKTFNRLNTDNEDSNMNTLNTSVMSRRSVSRSRVLNNKLGGDTTNGNNTGNKPKEKFTLFSPKVSININAGLNTESNLNKSVDRRNIRSVDRRKERDLENTTNNKSKVKGNTNNNNNNNKQTEVMNKTLNIKQLKPHSSAKKLNEDKESNSLKATPKKEAYNSNKGILNHTTSNNKSQVKKILRSKAGDHNNNDNGAKEKDKEKESKDITNNNQPNSAQQNRISFKFEPKKRTSLLNKESTHESTTTTNNFSNPFDFSNYKEGSFKSEENKESQGVPGVNVITLLSQNTQHQKTRSDQNDPKNLSAVKPKQLFTGSEDYNDNLEVNNKNMHYDLDNINLNGINLNKVTKFFYSEGAKNSTNNKVFINIFSFLNSNTKLKNISKALRKAYIQHHLNKISQTKQDKARIIEENANNMENLETVLELEILSHKEERLKGILSKI